MTPSKNHKAPDLCHNFFGEEEFYEEGFHIIFTCTKILKVFLQKVLINKSLYKKAL